MPGMEALDTADLAVVFLRFQDFPAEQMQHLDDYLDRGGPVVGLRTATHAFRMKAGEPFARYSFDNKGPGYELGFGHQVLGQTWVGHYGRNHQQSTRITVVDGKRNHPILRGVKDVWVQAGGYVGKPTDGDILTMAQPLNGMTPDSPVDETKPPMPSEWTRTYKSRSGKTGRVFTSLYGTPEDLLNDGYRRLLVNGCFWALGLEDAIKPDANIDFVGPFKPNTFGNGSHAAASSPKPTPVLRVPSRPTTTHGMQTPRPRKRPRSTRVPRRRRNPGGRPRRRRNPRWPTCRPIIATRCRSRSKEATSSPSSATAWPIACSTTAGWRRCCKASWSTSRCASAT